MAGLASTGIAPFLYTNTHVSILCFNVPHRNSFGKINVLLKSNEKHWPALIIIIDWLVSVFYSYRIVIDYKPK